MRFFSSALSISSLYMLTASALQKSEIRNCGVAGAPHSAPITGRYNLYEDGKSICATRDVEVNWNAGAIFELTMYGTRCFFHTEKFWPDARGGERFGYANCPGMGNIPAIKDEKDYSGRCGVSAVGCRNRAKMEWDGCLSCGKALCGSNSECSSGCCDKKSDFCSSPENSTCK